MRYVYILALLYDTFLFTMMFYHESSPCIEAGIILQFVLCLTSFISVIFQKLNLVNKNRDLFGGIFSKKDDDLPINLDEKF
jgi:hypothetical protein